ncbi:MAG: 1-deoxy-D-xylulose-5-phosphate reductoisomerase, partial [Prevotellaceae bacterium]|nr:1-deoxy-D-xylulose-5-phosphate reductoisomerase [Prevotellaceae bacterium]
LTFPERLPLDTPRLSFDTLGHLDFSAPDLQRFPCLSLAYHALLQGGNIPCTLNAANEVAVSAFLCDRISFTHIPVVIEKTMLSIPFISNPTLSQIHQTDSQARLMAQNLLNTF